jgi:hypothetical protein
VNPNHETRSPDAFETALQRAEASVRDGDTAARRHELGGLYFVDDRFEDAQRQWEMAFRMFRDGGQFREAAARATLEPTTLAVMHGASFRGDAATQLRALAAGYAARAAEAA